MMGLQLGAYIGRLIASQLRGDAAGNTRAMAGERFVSTALIALERRIDKVLGQERILSLKDLDVNGDDLMRELGITGGPQIGTILSFLLETVLDDPGQNRREQLLTIAKRFYEARLRAGPREE